MDDLEISARRLRNGPGLRCSRSRISNARGTPRGLILPAILLAMLVGEAGPALAQERPREPETEPAFAESPTSGRPGTSEALTRQSADGSPVSFRDSRVSYTLLGGASGFGWNTFDVQTAVFARQLSRLSVTPGFGASLLEGPDTTDVPAELYSLRLQFAWKDQINRRLGYEVAITPSLFTDFENTGSEAIRISGRALAFVAFSQQVRAALGVVYLDRDDIPAIPAAGLIYVPNEDLRWELIFPRPRVIGRVHKNEQSETWLYLAGELGGGTWGVRRQDGRDDALTYGDLRLIFGIERKFKEEWTAFGEAGYVFNRELEFDSGVGNVDLDDTFLIRAGFTR